MGATKFAELQTERSAEGRSSFGPLSGLAARLARDHSNVPLSTRALHMLAALPDDVPTSVLQAEARHVIEDIANCYLEPRSLKRLLDKLMFNSAPVGTSGLSIAALVELAELKNYFMHVMYGERPSVWDQSLGLL